MNITCLCACKKHKIQSKLVKELRVKRNKTSNFSLHSFFGFAPITMPETNENIFENV